MITKSLYDLSQAPMLVIDAIPRRYREFKMRPYFHTPDADDTEYCFRPSWGASKALLWIDRQGISHAVDVQFERMYQRKSGRWAIEFTAAPRAKWSLVNLQPPASETTP